MSATELERKPTRADRVESIARLGERLGRLPLQREIAAELGVSRTYASALVTDPTGEADRERKKRYAGTCENCGGPTDGSNGRTKAPQRCIVCIANGSVPRVPADRIVVRWDRQKCLDSIVRWVERNQRIPLGKDLIYAEPGERPSIATIIKYCYRYEPREERLDEQTWKSSVWWQRRAPDRIVRWNECVYNLHDVLVELAPRFPSNVVIMTARNATLRSRLFTVIGIEEVVRTAGEKVESDEYGTLWRIEGPKRRPDWSPGEPYMVVQVVNSTPEPDGSFKDYFLRVPPDVETPRAAIAWTFGVASEEYELAVQT